MPRHRYTLAIAATCFILALFYATLRFAGDSPSVSPGDHQTASRACHDAVRADIPDARFPFDPTIRTLADGGLVLSGSVDSGGGITAARHNYECYLDAKATAGTYRADSVHLWRSH